MVYAEEPDGGDSNLGWKIPLVPYHCPLTYRAPESQFQAIERVNHIP